ncbi:nephrin-like [Haemaphysalis longicornis]
MSPDSQPPAMRQRSRKAGGPRQMDKDPAESTSPLRVLARNGAQTTLPCPLQTQSGGSVAKPASLDEPPAVSELRWTRLEDPPERRTVYVVDGEAAGGGGVWLGEHVVRADWQSRSYFSVHSDPALLKIGRVAVADSGTYVCRVIFPDGRRANYTVYLRVVEPPTRPVIRDGSGVLLHGVTEPYDEDSSITLTCEVHGGDPPPLLSWSGSGYRASRVREERVREGNATRSVLRLGSLRRELLLSNFVCKVDESPEHLNSSIFVDMNLRPLSATLWSGQSNNTSRAELPAEFHCRALGSRPAALLSWWLGDERLEPFFHEESDSGNDSFSVLLFTPTAADHGKRVRCLATNDRMPGASLEAVWTLDVQYAPNVTLRLGKGLSEPVIEEGRDVYLECLASANPPVGTFRWLHRGLPLEPGNATSGSPQQASPPLVAGPYLIMRRVRPLHAGDYACEASNQLASVRSNIVHLTVQYSPRCERIWSSQSSDGSETLVHCSVRAEPEEPISFAWSVRDAKGERPAVQSGAALASSNGTLALLRVPQPPIALAAAASSSGHVTLYCRARNAVGSQSSPCVLAIDTAEKPGQLRGCSVSNQSDERLLVSCRRLDPRPGQRFVLELHGSPQSADGPVANLSSDQPAFWIPSLEPGASCRIVLYAVSARGTRGPAVQLTLHADPHTAPLASAGKKRGSASKISFGHIQITLPFATLVLFAGR